MVYQISYKISIVTIWGILEDSLYSSPLKLTKSISKPLSLHVAVSKCLDFSGLTFITPWPLISSPYCFIYSYNKLTNCSPIILSKAISISCESNPSN